MPERVMEQGSSRSAQRLALLVRAGRRRLAAPAIRQRPEAVPEKFAARHQQAIVRRHRRLLPFHNVVDDRCKLLLEGLCASRSEIVDDAANGAKVEGNEVHGLG